MEEKVFFQGRGTSVTSSKIVIEGNTYATRNVGSVRTMTVEAPFWPWIIMFIGAATCMSNAGLGIIIIVAAGFAIYANKEQTKLLLMAGGGESVAIQTKDAKFVKELHDAIVEAISAR